MLWLRWSIFDCHTGLCDNTSMIDSNGLIHQASNIQQDIFSGKVERMSDDALLKTAGDLGVSVPDGANWKDYRDAFSAYNWHDVTDAMERHTRSSYDSM